MIKRTGSVGGVLAALICVGAGVYMLLTKTEAQNSVFDVFLHGIGAYFIGKGIFIGVITQNQSEQNTAQKQLLELAETLSCTGNVFRYRMRLDERYQKLLALLAPVEDLGVARVVALDPDPREERHEKVAHAGAQLTHAVGLEGRLAGVGMPRERVLEGPDPEEPGERRRRGRLGFEDERRHGAGDTAALAHAGCPRVQDVVGVREAQPVDGVEVV